MNKIKFLFKLYVSAVEVVALAIDNLYNKHLHTFDDVTDENVLALVSLVDNRRYNLFSFDCFTSALQLLFWLKQNRESIYNLLLFDDERFSLFDCFVCFNPFILK